MPNVIAAIGVPGLIAIAVLYFVPAMIVAVRRSAKARRIVLLNVFLGWTAVGWIAALAWSIVDARPADQRRVMKRCTNCARPNLASVAKCDYCGATIPADAVTYSPARR